MVSLVRVGSREACEGMIKGGEGSEGSERIKGGREGSMGGGSLEDKTEKGLEEEGRSRSGGGWAERGGEEEEGQRVEGTGGTYSRGALDAGVDFFFLTVSHWPS